MISQTLINKDYFRPSDGKESSCLQGRLLLVLPVSLEWNPEINWSLDGIQPFCIQPWRLICSLFWLVFHPKDSYPRNCTKELSWEMCQSLETTCTSEMTRSQSLHIFLHWSLIRRKTLERFDHNLVCQNTYLVDRVQLRREQRTCHWCRWRSWRG